MPKDELKRLRASEVINHYVESLHYRSCVIALKLHSTAEGAGSLVRPLNIVLHKIREHFWCAIRTVQFDRRSQIKDWTLFRWCT